MVVMEVQTRASCKYLAARRLTVNIRHQGLKDIYPLPAYRDCTRHPIHVAVEDPRVALTVFLLFQMEGVNMGRGD